MGINLAHWVGNAVKAAGRKAEWQTYLKETPR